MICIDSNVVIYLAQGVLSADVVSRVPVVYPSILRIETLGYHQIRSAEEQRVRELLSCFQEIAPEGAIIERAIRLRQLWRISLGDAIVAATALEQACELWTANEVDFSRIDGLVVVNPLAL